MAETGNKVVQNFGLNPATNFNFILRVEGVFDLPCKSVHVFQKENEYEYIQEGGLNDYVHMKRKPISKPFTFQVERYVGVDGLLVDYLANGTELVLPLVLLVNRYHWNGYPYPTRTYVFTGCTVIGKEYGELNAERSGLLVETTTIAYREMVNVDVGLGANAEDPWKYKPKTEKEKEEEEKKRLTHSERYWQFDKSAYDGKGKGSAHHPVNEKRREDLLKERRLWNPDGKKAEKSQSSARQPEDFLEVATQEEGQESGQIRDRLWEFDRKTYSGNGETSARHPENEKRKEELLKGRRLWNPDGKKAEKSQSSARQPEEFLEVETQGEGQEDGQTTDRLWEFDEKIYSGNGEMSARHPENEKRREELLKGRRLWNPEQNKVSPSTRSARTVADYLGSREKKATGK